MLYLLFQSAFLCLWGRSDRGKGCSIDMIMIEGGAVFDSLFTSFSSYWLNGGAPLWVLHVGKRILFFRNVCMNKRFKVLA